MNERMKVGMEEGTTKRGRGKTIGEKEEEGIEGRKEERQLAYSMHPLFIIV
jgi:hypothetical protein